MFIPLYDHNPLRSISRPYVNYALIATTVLAFFATGGIDPEAVQRAAVGLGFIPSVANGIDYIEPGLEVVPEQVTYVSYAFLHVNLLHMAGNLLFLWVFGDNVEDALGHARYFLFYLLVAAAGAGAHNLHDPFSQVPLIGASGAVSGVVAAYLVLHPRVKIWILAFGRIPLRLTARTVIVAWALFQLLNLYLATAGEDVAWWAHVGGFAGGILLVLVLKRRNVAILDAGTPDRNS